MGYFFQGISKIYPKGYYQVDIRLYVPGKRNLKKRSNKERKVCWIKNMMLFVSDKILGDNCQKRKNKQEMPGLVIIDDACYDKS